MHARRASVKMNLETKAETKLESKAGNRTERTMAESNQALFSSNGLSTSALFSALFNEIDLGENIKMANH